MDSDTKTCSRPGCEKKLRRTNTHGVCRTGCHSPDAPEAARVVGKAKPTKSSAPSTDALKNFRVVATALGLDPEALLAEFAESWLKALRDQVDQ